jgi:hypothetical protein
MFLIHKHKISESQSTMLTGPPRLNLSDAQTLISDRFSKNKELTKRTLCGIVVFKLDTNFSHVFCVLMGLISTDSMYSRIPGDQGGLIFFSLRGFFLGARVCTNWLTPICSILF